MTIGTLCKITHNATELPPCAIKSFLSFLLDLEYNSIFAIGKISPLTMRRSIKIITTVLLLCFVALSVQSQVPDKPDPLKLVNDFAGILGDTQEMEDSLERIALHTSNQICVVTMTDLGGMSPGVMAQAIGNKWGVGTDDKNNGVVILIKPKTQDSNGEVFISPGTGLVNTISNDRCSSIANDYMIPHFKENDYVSGTWAGINEVYNLAIQVYNAPVPYDNKSTNWIPILLTFIGGIVLGGGGYALYKRSRH